MASTPPGSAPLPGTPPVYAESDDGQITVVDEEATPEMLAELRHIPLLLCLPEPADRGRFLKLLKADCLRAMCVTVGVEPAVSERANRAFLLCWYHEYVPEHEAPLEWQTGAGALALTMLRANADKAAEAVAAATLAAYPPWNWRSTNDLILAGVDEPARHADGEGRILTHVPPGPPPPVTDVTTAEHVSLVPLSAVDVPNGEVAAANSNTGRVGATGATGRAAPRRNPPRAAQATAAARAASQRPPAPTPTPARTRQRRRAASSGANTGPSTRAGPGPLPLPPPAPDGSAPTDRISTEQATKLLALLDSDPSWGSDDNDGSSSSSDDDDGDSSGGPSDAGSKQRRLRRKLSTKRTDFTDAIAVDVGTPGVSGCRVAGGWLSNGNAVSAANAAAASFLTLPAVSAGISNGDDLTCTYPGMVVPRSREAFSTLVQELRRETKGLARLTYAMKPPRRRAASLVAAGIDEAMTAFEKQWMSPFDELMRLPEVRQTMHESVARYLVAMAVRNAAIGLHATSRAVNANMAALPPAGATLFSMEVDAYLGPHGRARATAWKAQEDLLAALRLLTTTSGGRASPDWRPAAQQCLAGTLSPGQAANTPALIAIADVDELWQRSAPYHALFDASIVNPAVAVAGPVAAKAPTSTDTTAGGKGGKKGGQ